MKNTSWMKRALRGIWGAAAIASALTLASRAHAQGAGVIVTNFAQAIPSGPAGNPALGADGNLYGLTQAGGPSHVGSIQRITPAGSSTNLFSFSGTDGSYPAAGLLILGDTLIGTATDDSGGGGNGRLFSYNLTTGTYDLLFVVGTNGSQPDTTPVTTDGTTIYFGTYVGGRFNDGNILAVSNGILVGASQFDGTNGARPVSACYDPASGYIYGTTLTGGKYQVGTIFRTNPTNMVTAALYSFTNATSGQDPNDITSINGMLYGDTRSSNSFNHGTIWSFNAANSNLTTLHVFTETNSSVPQGVILGVDGALYGTCKQGATNGFLYHMDIDGGNYSILAYISNSAPNLPVFGDDGALYITPGSGFSSAPAYRVSVPMPTGLTALGGDCSGITGTFPSVIGEWYQLIVWTNLASPHINVGSPVMATSGLTSITDTNISPTAVYSVIPLTSGYTLEHTNRAYPVTPHLTNNAGCFPGQVWTFSTNGLPNTNSGPPDINPGDY